MEKILVLDFGGQYNMLIARRVREAHVYAEIKPYNKITAEEIAAEGYAGIIFTGGPNSVYDEKSPHFDPAVLRLGIPVLGICYGHQLIAWMEGGEVRPAGDVSEYGKVKLYVRTYKKSPLFANTYEKSECWMSHTDQVVTPPEGFEVTASTINCKCAAMCDEKRHIYGVQFHPEVTHTVYGRRMIENFLFRVCGCKGEWRIEDYTKTCVEKYRAELAGKRVLCALSGGVDSTVAAVMMHKAIGDNLVCVFVDHGLLRMAEGDIVEGTFRETFNMNIVRVNAADRFLSRLAGVTDPEQKRKIIGEEFIRVFEDEAERLGKFDALVQGTIYPDVIESGKGDASVIKSHHNVGGLPDVINFERIVEPLRDLFKDEVRAVGEQLGIPYKLVWRQPFPGPGLAIRVLGEVTREKLYTLRGADAIFREELEDYFHGHAISQYFAVLTDSHSVGVLGDERAYGRTIVLRAVTTDDFMTADWAHLPYDLLEKVSSRITNEVKGITRVVFDITSKPPATVEWE